MTEEQKHQRKKSGLIKKIFKWIGLSILTLLILLALVVEAPKKLVILLVIILAACTALPRPYRKYFWLTAACVAIALIIWIFLPVNNEGWQPYKYNFDTEYKKLETKYSIPPEENAAIIYNKLLEKYDANDYMIFDSDPNTFHGTFQKPWLSKDYPEIADGLKHNQSIIETLIEISKIDKCIFPISDPADSDTKYDKNSAIRCWARLLVIAINNDIAEGRHEKAVEKIAAILQMAKHQCQQPTTIDFMTGISVEQMAFIYLNRIIIEQDLIDSHIKIIEKALPDIKNDWNSVFAKNIEYDKLWAKIELTNYYEVNSKGRIRLTRDPMAWLRASGRELYQDAEIDNEKYNVIFTGFLYPTYLQQKLTKAKTILRWLTMPSDPEKAAEILGACLNQYNVMAEPDFDWTTKPQQPDLFITSNNFYRQIYYYIHFDRLIADKWAKNNYRLREVYLRALALRRGTRILLAIKQYNLENGEWPDSLDEITASVSAQVLIDPAGGNFDYENHGERFSLYGKSINIWPQ